MSGQFDLVITTDNSRRIAEFFLRDSAGAQLAYRPTDFTAVPAGRQRTLRIQLPGAAEEGSHLAAALGQVEAWWQRHRSGQPVPEADHTETLARAFIAAPDIATQGHFAQHDWPAALRRSDAILDVKRALQRPPKDIAGDRMNRANILGPAGGACREVTGNSSRMTAQKALRS